MGLAELYRISIPPGVSCGAGKSKKGFNLKQHSLFRRVEKTGQIEEADWRIKSASHH